VRTAPFLFITNMAMLPESARTAASYLGGGIARSMEKQGGKIAQAGAQIAEASKSTVGQKVGQFLGGLGQAVEKSGATAGMKEGLKKRDIGLAAAGAAMTGAFVGGMGANSGIHALMGYQLSDPRTSVQGDTPQIGGNVMPADLQTSYIALNQPGSPLGIQMMRQNVDVKAAQDRQRLLRAAMTGMMGSMGEKA